MTQSFLETGQHVTIAAGFHEQHPRGRKPGLLQRGGKQIGGRDDPQHLAFRARGDAGGETRSRGGVQRVIAATGHLVQRAQGEATAGQSAIDVRHTKRQDRAATVSMTFQTADLVAQCLQVR